MISGLFVMEIAAAVLLLLLVVVVVVVVVTVRMKHVTTVVLDQGSELSDTQFIIRAPKKGLSFLECEQ